MEPRTALRGRLVLWSWIWAGWTALALFVATSLWLNYVALGREASFRATLLVAISEWWIWALLTPAVIGLVRWVPLRRPGLGRAVVVHALAGAALATIKVSAERGLRIWLFGAAPYLLPSNLALHFLVYWAIVGATLAAAYYRDSQARALAAAETEARLNEARLQLLHAQLQPHFLFNALTAVAEAVHEDADRADRMITSLSELLRASLDEDADTVPLAQEMTLARRYLDIQQARFGDRLRVGWTLPADCAAAAVPRLVLQPLLENAVHHGIAPTRDGGTITMEARREHGSLVLTVSDDGRGIPAAGVNEGVGLGNTRARLRALYGDEGQLALAARDGGGTVAIVRLPERET